MRSIIRKSFSVLFILCFMLVGLSFAGIGKIKVKATGVMKDYVSYNGSLIEGDYVIVYSDKAIKNEVSSNRLSYYQFEKSPTTIVRTDDISIIWHIAQDSSGEYWTIYNAAEDKYAASNGTKNQAQMLADGTDDKALWTVTGTSTYDFVNKANSAKKVNANLRNNGTYGFACYATSTGDPLSLFKAIEITFDKNGGTGVSPNSINVYNGTALQSIPDCSFTKSGHIFTGWNTESNGSGTSYDVGDTLSSVTGDIVLYAQWEEVFTVTFESYGGLEVSSIYNIHNGEKISRPIDPSWSGHYFDGWYKNVGLSEAWDFDVDTVTTNITLYAKWVDATTYDVEFIDPYESLVLETKIVLTGSKTNSYGIGYKFGYSLDGWYTKDGSSDDDWGNEFDFNTSISANISLYAKYTEESWKIDLESKETKSSLKFNIVHHDASWTKVTNASQLSVGDQVVIASANYDYALSTTQNNNNRGQASITKDGDTIEFDENTQVFTLEEGTESNTFSFYTGSKYIYAAGTNSNNYLRDKDTKSATSSFTISIVNGEAIITAQGDITRNLLQYNSSNSIFSCYANSQQAVCIYKFIDEYDEFDYAAIRFGIRLTVAEYEMLSDAGTLGVELSYTKDATPVLKRIDFDGTSGKNIVRVDGTGKADSEGDYYQFAVVLKGLENLTDMSIEAKVYVTDGVDYIYAQKAGTTNNGGNDYSFEDMINYYYDNRVSLALSDAIIASLERAKDVLGL